MEIKIDIDINANKKKFKAPSHGLASFGIHFLSLKGSKLVDESMSASIILCDVQLDDIRPGRQNMLTK